MIKPESPKQSPARLGSPNQAPVERDQPKLHEAMRTILLRKKNRTAAFVAISIENQRNDLYRRPADGKHPNALQIRARAAKYHKLFKRIGGGEVQYIGPIPPAV
jgi:hypothetical protein